MVYGAALLPPWRRAPPLAHVYVVAVRAENESWPRLLSTRLGPGSNLVFVLSGTLTRMIRFIANHSRFTWTLFFRLPLVEVPSGFFELPITNSIVLVSQKVTQEGDFPPDRSLRILRRFERGLCCCMLHIPVQSMTTCLRTTQARHKSKRQKPQEKKHVSPHLSVYKNVNLYSCATSSK